MGPLFDCVAGPQLTDKRVLRDEDPKKQVIARRVCFGRAANPLLNQETRERPLMAGVPESIITATPRADQVQSLQALVAAGQLPALRDPREALLFGV